MRQATTDIDYGLQGFIIHIIPIVIVAHLIKLYNPGNILNPM